MHRNPLLTILSTYIPNSIEEENILQQFHSFVTQTPKCFSRSSAEGHVTGSAFVLSPEEAMVLFTHHAKLKKWFQLGGHADDCPHVLEVAHREAMEESGLSEIFIHDRCPIDIDIHEIPKNTKDPAHLHYDVRYVFTAKNTHYIQSSESLALQWIPLISIENYCQEPGILRAIAKIKKKINNRTFCKTKN